MPAGLRPHRGRRGHSAATHRRDALVVVVAVAAAGLPVNRLGLRPVAHTVVKMGALHPVTATHTDTQSPGVQYTRSTMLFQLSCKLHFAQ